MDRYDTQIFAKNLSRLLESHHISQRDIAKILSVSSSTVSSWCTGQKIPRMDKIERLASYFGVLKSDLIEEKPTPVSEDGLDAEKRAFIEKLKSMDSETVAVLNKLADSIISKRN